MTFPSTIGQAKIPAVKGVGSFGMVQSDHAAKFDWPPRQSGAPFWKGLGVPSHD